MEGLTGKHRKDDEDAYLTKKERRAAIRAALGHYLPILFMVLACFTLTALLIYFWLMP